MILRLIIVLLFGAAVGCAKMPEKKDLTMGVKGTCNIHGVAMRKEIVPIIHGDLPVVTFHDQARAKTFPNIVAPEYIYDSPSIYTSGIAVIYVCADCLREERRWTAENGNVRGQPLE